MDTKTCPHCGVAFARTTERNRDWGRKQFCSKLCATRQTGLGKRLHPIVGPKACAQCGAAIDRRAGEDGQAWRKRQTCGHTCAALLRQARRRASA